MIVEPGAGVAWRQQESEAWRDLVASPFENQGFVEARRYLLRKPAPQWTLLVDDEPLENDRNDNTTAIWEPGFFAGQVMAELRRPDGTLAAPFVLDVAPDPSKLGHDMFARMVNELWEEDPALVIGSEPATNEIGDLGTFEDPWLAFSRLRRYGPEFLRALTLLRSHPRRALRVQRDSSPLHHARRVDRQTATSILRGPALAFFAPGTVATGTVTHIRIDVPVTEETLDAAANRTMLALLQSFVLRVSTVAKRLEGQVARDRLSETRTPLASRWPARKQFLHELGAAAKIALRSVPFPQVRGAEISAAGLTAIAADPIYSRAWSRGWRALRHGIESGATNERLWISPSWEIYEKWCFMRLGQIVSTAAPSWDWQRPHGGLRLTGQTGDRVTTLALQQTFPATGGISDGRWSVSRQREPDIVLTVESPTECRFATFDAKYRASRANVLDAMQSAHIYQDSLRIGKRRPEASFLLVPSAGGAPWLEAPAFHLEHRVGVLPLAPDTALALPSIITQMLWI